MTFSERKLWAELRKLDLHIRRQAPIGRFVVDSAHHSAKLVIEVDGASHNFPEVVLRDEARDAWLNSQGYRVIRIKDAEAIDRPAEVAERIGAIIKGARLKAEGSAAPFAREGQPRVGTPPSPALPPLRGKGG